MILKEIRNRTAVNHTRLEQSPLLLPISQSTLSLDTYVQILQKFYCYFAPIELKLDRFVDLTKWLPDYTERRKTKLLLDDLQWVAPGQSLPPACSHLPLLESLAQAFGCLYVMEGSTLGGKLIYRVLHERLQLNASRGASFFYGYGEQTGTRWKAFGQVLQEFCAQTQQDEIVINTANETFIKLEEWLQTPL